VVLLAVRWYLQYGLSYRDVEELLAERGIEVVRRTHHSDLTGCSAPHRLAAPLIEQRNTAV
jgi:transposase-like protein